MNIPKYTDVFVKEMQRRKYSERTVDNYRSGIGLFLNNFKNKEHPLHLNESDIKEYLSKFDEPNTQRSHHGAIKLFYEICLGQKDKFKYIPYCKKSMKLPIVLSQSEIQLMFDNCKNLKHKVILSLLYSCGLRVSELINLKWEHIDRSRMVINIIQAKGKKDRQVMLSESIIPLLEKYYLKYRSKIYVLNGQFHLTYSSTSVLNIVKQLALKSGISKRVYTHLIRHCSFTHMFEEGTDINLIQRLAGHSNVKTTAIYCHTSNNVISKINSPINNIRL